jgi:hypothetical protein
MATTEELDAIVTLPRATRLTPCPTCEVNLPFPPGPLVTCPRCAPRPEVAGRIAAELVEAALADDDALVTRDLLSNAEAWRRVVV